jgi:hypothetical protein
MLVAVGLLAGCATATPMPRPAHVPETAWTPCADEATAQVGPGTLERGMNALDATSPSLAMTGGALLGLAGDALTDAIAPDPATAQAWKWNHAVGVCLRVRGISLP